MEKQTQLYPKPDNTIINFNTAISRYFITEALKDLKKQSHTVIVSDDILFKKATKIAKKEKRELHKFFHDRALKDMLKDQMIGEDNLFEFIISEERYNDTKIITARF